MRGTTAYGDNVRCVKMYNAFEVWSCGVDGRMEHESGNIDAKVGRSCFDDGALHVHLDQARSRDLVVKHAERIEQEMLSILSNANLKLHTHTQKLV